MQTTANAAPPPLEGGRAREADDARVGEVYCCRVDVLGCGVADLVSGELPAWAINDDRPAVFCGVADGCRGRGVGRGGAGGVLAGVFGDGIPRVPVPTGFHVFTPPVVDTEMDGASEPS